MTLVNPDSRDTIAARISQQRMWGNKSAEAMWESKLPEVKHVDKRCLKPDMQMLPLLEAHCAEEAASKKAASYPQSNYRHKRRGLLVFIYICYRTSSALVALRYRANRSQQKAS
eukprot:GHVU01057093.1.p2 GENE.GHVU01057093.1~~GHVU01057093.1.p2  ORF type:complete len:114 (+),score=11.24 GHVU01057093.1:419-760(+)